MQLAIGPLGDLANHRGAALDGRQCAAGSCRELLHLAALAPMSVPASAGAFCRPGRLKKKRRGGREGRERPGLSRI